MRGPPTRILASGNAPNEPNGALPEVVLIGNETPKAVASASTVEPTKVIHRASHMTAVRGIMLVAIGILAIGIILILADSHYHFLPPIHAFTRM